MQKVQKVQKEHTTYLPYKSRIELSRSQQQQKRILANLTRSSQVETRRFITTRSFSVLRAASVGFEVHWIGDGIVNIKLHIQDNIVGTTVGAR
jgi:hypothetical protein